MKIAINTLPLETAHKYRGIGYYTSNLIKALETDKSIDILRFTSEVELKNVDGVHYPWFDLFFHTLPIRKHFPTIITIHDIIPLIFPKYYPVGLRGKFNYFLQKLALSNCKFIITDSLSSKKDIVKYLKIDDRKISVISLAADNRFKVLSDNQLIHIQRKYKLPANFLLYVGDANWVKNLPFLIKGFNQLKKSDFKNLTLVLVGGVFLKNVENIDHPELESLRQVNRMIKEYNIENAIIRPGNLEIDELIAFYNLATIYIQPSFYEGFGLPVLEAMSCGTPVVCSGMGSLTEVAGNAAVFFDPSKLNQFILIVTEILSSKSLQYKLSKLGLIQATKFSWDKVAGQTKLVYTKALDLKNDQVA